MTPGLSQLSRRERQLMEAIYRLGQATAVQIAEALPDAPSNSAIRTHLRILEEKGYLEHREEGGRFLFLPIETPEKARRSAVKQLIQTFFEGSLTKAVTALVDGDAGQLSAADLKRLETVIQNAKSKSKSK